MQAEHKTSQRRAEEAWGTLQLYLSSYLKLRPQAIDRINDHVKAYGDARVDRDRERR